MKTNRVIINSDSLEEFLTADGEEYGPTIEARMDTYCDMLAERMNDGTVVTYGRTNGEDIVPDDVRQLFDEASNWVSDQLGEIFKRAREEQ